MKPLYDTDEYADIIDLPHHVSPRHTRMSRQQRAAQFASFAALKGHDEEIETTAADHAALYSSIIGDR